MTQKTGSSSAPLSCPHPNLTPRWDRMEDIGHKDRVTAWYCAKCGHFLPPEAGAKAAL